MAKLKTVFVCSVCGYETKKWLGKCPDCENYNTLAEEVVEESYAKGRTGLTIPKESFNAAIKLDDVDNTSSGKTSTGIEEFDRVLNGGVTKGSLILVGGEPGIGKSTLLLQISQNMSAGDEKVLYVSGEESAAQIKSRADRLGVDSKNLYLLAETNLSVIIEQVQSLKPVAAIVDSIQTVFCDTVSGLPGGVSQIRESTYELMNIAKSTGTTIIIVGHVTKDGSLAGPRMLEHIVDTVLYFEGERRELYRAVRSVKNRFGNTNEIGVFEMTEKGLEQIKNPSAYLLSGRPLNVAGSVITAAIEGTRPILTEIQALVAYSKYASPARNVTGIDYNRASMLIAVLEKRGGLILSDCDCYVNMVGGMKIFEPSIDAAIILALASSFKNKAVSPDMAVFGEVGLTGELRTVSFIQKRIDEAKKLGFKECVVPQTNLKGIKTGDVKVYGVGSVGELLELGLG